MRLLSFLLFLFLLTQVNPGNAQAPKDFAVPLTATVNLFPPSVTLEWPNPTPAGLQLLRRTKGQAGNQWIQLLSATGSSLTSYQDNNISLGQTYEYAFVRTTTLNAFGYAHVAVRGPVVDNRGKILIFVDSTTADALGVELVRMKNDMRGDGWVVQPYKTGPSSTVASVKAQIVADYNADPQNVKAVLLIGDVPVPYSGNIARDGHTPDHDGAWPADVYYGDVNGVWTDVSVNNTAPARDANDNVPGDGKFDQSVVPSPVELQVGRIDFRHIDAPAFGEANAIGLVRRYLDKDHAWRTGAYKVENKALIDDNFGFLNGQEPFAMTAYLTAYPLMPEENVVAADFFNNSNPESYLFGYGCGGGSYTSAGGVGNSNNFATDTVNMVFTGLFGSYFGDWDSENNPFMVSALASRGGILTCSWAGRPHWFNHALASGETIGYCNLETQNAQYNNGFYGTYGESGAHVSLLGDPTLRAHIVPPPQNVVATASCTRVQLAWNSPTESVDGYHIYRSLSNDGPYTRITTNIVSDTIYFDNNPIADTLFYQVRAIKTQFAPGGGFYSNNSVGPISYVVYTPGTPPTLNLVGGELNCVVNTLNLQANSNTTLSSYEWSGPGGFFSQEASPAVTTPGNYSVVVSDAGGCTASGSIFIAQNTLQPVVNLFSTGLLTCANTTALLAVSSTSALDPNGYTWSNGATTTNLEVSAPGTYSVTVTDQGNGCTVSESINQQQDVEAPNLDFPTTVSYTCTTPCVTVNLPLPNVYDYALNQEPLATGADLQLCNAGIYTLTVTTENNGCTTDYDIEVIANVQDPGANIGGQTLLSCTSQTIQLIGSTSGSEVTFYWTGPGISPQTQNQQSPTINIPGTYTLVVTDTENGCTSEASVNIEADQSLPVAFATGGTINCLQSTVVLSSNGSSAGAGVSYVWTGPNGFVSNDANPETTFPGNYTLVVSTGNGCSAQATAVVAEDTGFPAGTVVTNALTVCSGGCDVLSWAPFNPAISVAPDTICDSGTYDIVVTNSNNGCTFTTSATIGIVPPLTAEFEPGFVDCDGTVTLTVQASGGTLPYSYLWSNGSTLQSALYLLDGSPITVVVTDANGCTWENDPLIIPAPTPISVNSTVADESGTGEQDGAISLSVSGGTPPFEFQWSNGATTQNLSNLPGGTYTVTITEITTGCTAEYTYVVNTSVSTQESAVVNSLTLSPNPSTGLAYLTVGLNDMQTIKVEVRDALGRLVIDNPSVEAVTLNLPIDLAKHPQGVYQVVISAGNQVMVRKLVIAR